MLTTFSTVAITGLLVFGTITSLFAKIVYGLKSVGLDGEEKEFRKPYCMTTVMFTGMCFCLPVYYAAQAFKRQRGIKDQQDAQPLLQQSSAPAQAGVRNTLLLAIPTVFDLVATVLMNIGLLNVTASVYQMMRGAEVLFAAAFSMLFLGRRLNHMHFLGIACCMVGILLVGLSSVLGGDTGGAGTASAETLLLGMGLIVISQAVQAAQVTFEDYFMADLAVPPLLIVGWEGVYGVVFMLGLVLPIMAAVPGLEGGGIHEDSLDTLQMIRSSSRIKWVLGVDMLALLFYNLAGMCVTGELGAVFRTVLETMRTLFVWLADLLLYYTLAGQDSLGEAWTSWSYLQAAGFVVLVCGTLIYGKGDEREVRASLDIHEAEQPSTTSGVTGQREQESRTDSIPVRASRRSLTAPRPIMTPSSMKSTLNINSFASLRQHSLARSVSRSRAHLLEEETGV